MTALVVSAIILAALGVAACWFGRLKSALPENEVSDKIKSLRPTEVGFAYTDLRPSGKICIGEDIFDATTEGDFINKNDVVVIRRIEGNVITVRAKDCDCGRGGVNSEG